MKNMKKSFKFGLWSSKAASAALRFCSPSIRFSAAVVLLSQFAIPLVSMADSVNSADPADSVQASAETQTSAASAIRIPELDLSTQAGIWLPATSSEVENAEKQAPTLSATLSQKKRCVQILPIAGSSCSQIRVSTDGGANWSSPRELPTVLSGNGHTLGWLSDGRIIAAFRGFDATSSSTSTSSSDAKPNAWFLWIGNFADLMDGTDGIYRLRLGSIPTSGTTESAEEVEQNSKNPCFLTIQENGTVLTKIWVSETDSQGTSRSVSRWLRLSSGRISSLDWEMMQTVHFAEPEVVEGSQPTLTPPPEGATVLFDGKNLDAFSGVENWTLGENWMQVGKGSAQTRQKFGSCRLHLEFATPAEVKGTGQHRGNSGIYIMSRYELQIMDSYQNSTYPQGQCGAIYTQNPPLKNVCRKPGEWQSYDIEFTAPLFDADGNVVRPARITAWQNGVLIQDDFELIGRNFFLHRYLPHEAKEPLQIQDHGCPVRFRNIWILETEN